ncbi:ATP-binding protein [Methyloglobulus sp.]|uniref:sensor histidine kinase n=1 Tax=Methyloglobulus sp. TaxID=2518622 RepID=UPI0032B84C64
MMTLRNLPIKTKLIAMMMLSASIGIFVMAVVISINEAVTMRHDIEAELATLAQVIGSRSTGSLTFNDPRTANENLNALATKKDIVYAAIYQEDGLLFAEYKTTAGNSSLQQQDSSRLTRILHFVSAGKFAGTIEVSNDINFENKQIGTVQIQSDMTTFFVKLLRYLSWVVITLLGCFALSFAVSTRLHKLISTPILDLQAVTSTLAKDDDYSVRIPIYSSDELGNLINSFNTMLEQIEIRDQKLAEYSKHLEILVDERTGELTEANNRRIQWLENMAKFLKHELKNASIGVKSSLELIERRSQQPSINIYLERAKKSLNYMNILLTSVSNASSLEAMIYKEPLNPVNLGLIVKSQIDEYKLSYPQYQFIGDIDHHLNIMGNEDRLRQLLDNLVNNAIEHSHLRTPVTVNLLNNAGIAEISVINEGVKLPDDKDKIFDLFVSLRDAGHWKSDNLGLGLYLVKLITEGHGGWVQASDLPDKAGAIFTVKIPQLVN